MLFHHIQEERTGRNDVNVRVESDYKLFYSPDIVIEKNDTIECMHEGSRYILTAGKQYTLPSHAELPVSERKRITHEQEQSGVNDGLHKLKRN